MQPPLDPASAGFYFFSPFLRFIADRTIHYITMIITQGKAVRDQPFQAMKKSKSAGLQERSLVQRNRLVGEIT